MQALWMLLAAFFFATMGVFIKWAATDFNSFEIVFYRGLVGMIFLYGLTRLRGVSLRTRVPTMHFWRSVVGNVALVAWFYAISVLPLATAMTLNYMSSIWIAAFLLGAALLTQKPNAPLSRQSPLFVCVLAGFAGVAMVLRPSLNPDQVWGGLLGLISGVFSALAYLQVAALSRAGEPETRTVFYFSLGATLAGALGMLVLGMHPITPGGAAQLLAIGLLAVLGQLCMTRAYASGATLVVANLQYAGIVFASGYGLALFGDRLPLVAWLGMGLIVLSGIAATALRTRALPRAPGEGH